MGGQLRRLVRIAALLALALGAAAEWALRRGWQRAVGSERWHAEWRTRWARRALRALHVRLTLYGHLPSTGLLVANDAGPFGPLVVAALGLTPFLSRPDDAPDAIDDAMVAHGVLAVFMRARELDTSLLECAATRRWPLAPTWIEPLRDGPWFVLSRRTIPLTVAIATAEPARGAVTTLRDSIDDQMRLLAHATRRGQTSVHVLEAA